MNPFQLLRGNLDAELIHGRMICITSMPIFVVTGNGVEGEHISSSHQQALFNSPAHLSSQGYQALGTRA